MDGIVLVDKPAGKTSRDITTVVGRTVGDRRTGHSGTLDPFATGLLIVLVGRGRRAQRFFMDLPKEYEAVARFGYVSTTGDPEGEITQTGVLPAAELPLPIGRIRQRPPAYSAVHVDGVRAYERARRGEEVEIPEREVTIYAFDELWRTEDRAGYRIVCSSGTYIRSLIADLGDAYTEELRRTAVGAFRVEDADPERIVPLGDALGFFMRVELTEEEGRRATHGMPVAPAAPLVAPGAAWLHSTPPAEVLLVDGQGPVALAERRPDGSLKPRVGFRG
ncbi:unannotated protein [freshwater metagenome]|uniref:tRNA pseudouridine(55) synthase n=1 Tax=freshwater metagenome TaxID=449393 RepID=A0A6J7HZI6_9ZZZZ|nr:tRNA pseudouridine(55) synthase TruB [Actinomycetota bacterium]